MPRARIPYDNLDLAAITKYPYPMFKNVRIERKERYNNIPSPTVVYDRSSGNYQRIGFKCTVTLEQFDGLEKDDSRFRPRGYVAKYISRRFTDILQPE